MTERKGTNLALVFGGGGSSDAASAGGPLGDESSLEDVAEDLGGDMAADDEDAEAMPPDFAVHASEAFPELAGDDARLEAFYRTIKACHPGV